MSDKNKIKCNGYTGEYNSMPAVKDLLVTEEFIFIKLKDYNNENFWIELKIPLEIIPKSKL